MKGEMSFSVKFVNWVWKVFAVISVMVTVYSVVMYPKQYQKNKAQLEGAVNEGYVVTYNGENLAELGYKELSKYYTLTYLPVQKKILLERRAQGGTHRTNRPVIVPIIH